MSTQTTRYGIPFPELPDKPDLPVDLSATAGVADSALGVVEDMIHLPRIVIGRMTPPGAIRGNLGAGGPIEETLGFAPQLVLFTCQVVSPFYSSGVVATYDTGRLGFNATRGLTQELTGVRSSHDKPSLVHERRTIYGYCAGVIIDDTSATGLAKGEITPTGFILNFEDTTGSNLAILWEAFE